MSVVQQTNDFYFDWWILMFKKIVYLPKLLKVFKYHTYVYLRKKLLTQYDNPNDLFWRMAFENSSF